MLNGAKTYEYNLHSMTENKEAVKITHRLNHKRESCETNE